ncbi:class II glutamine amidotransferase [Hydromonas duriensis]|nr:class II glutamine amidotransferase [Hydromonas duriensis]
MCQLLGMNCNTPTDIIFSFEGFAQRGGLTDHHTDGWGIAFFEGRACRLLMDCQPSILSPVADLVRAYPIKSLNVIAHIRKATQGEVNLENCHPFVREMWGRQWVFAHNGNLVDFHPELDGRFHPVGTTDSERAFCYMLQKLREACPNSSAAQPPSLEDIHAALSAIAKDIARFGTFNFCLSNGQAMWAHCSTNLYYIVREHPFAHAHLLDKDVAINFAEHTTPQDRVAVMATAPLTDNEVWQKMLVGEFVMFKDGCPCGGLNPIQHYKRV